MEQVFLPGMCQNVVHFTFVAKMALCLYTQQLMCCLCRVTAHFVAVKGAPKPKTTILMKFDSSVLLREQRLPTI